jgi:hypothetical protein
MAIVTAGAAAGIALGGGSPERTPAGGKSRPGVVVAESLDLLSSATAEDWVRHASVVAVVTVIGEQAGDIAEDDRDRGEGTIRRDVEMRVDERLWTRPGTSVPDRVVVGTTGWAWSDGRPGERARFVNAGRPWFEVGQQYLVALAHWPATPEAELTTCADVPEPGGWGPLGQYAAAPVTRDVIGVGELEGDRRSLADALDAANGPEELAVEGGTLRGRLYGRTVDAVAPALEEAAAVTAPEEIPGPSCCGLRARPSPARSGRSAPTPARPWS